MKFRCLVLAVAIIAGCSSGDDKKIEPVVVGGKSTTEQRVLVELVAQKIEGAGMPVDRRFDMGTTSDLDSAIRAGKIDVYVEYGGTALINIARSAAAASVLAQGRDAIMARLRAEYGSTGLTWTEPLGLDAPYTLVVRGGSGAFNISEAARASHGWRAAFSWEFQQSSGGYPAARRAYAFDFPETKTLEASKLYPALADHSVDIVEGHATDPELQKLHFLALEDDKHAFGTNPAVPVVRIAALQKFPNLKGALDGMVDWLDAQKMREMNEKVANNGTPVGDVVRQFISDQSLF